MVSPHFSTLIHSGIFPSLIMNEKVKVWSKLIIIYCSINPLIVRSLLTYLILCQIPEKGRCWVGGWSRRVHKEESSIWPSKKVDLSYELIFMSGIMSQVFIYFIGRSFWLEGGFIHSQEKCNKLAWRYCNVKGWYLFSSRWNVFGHSFY